MEETTKKCRACGAEKPLSDFQTYRRGDTGNIQVRSKCIPCYREMHREFAKKPEQRAYRRNLHKKWSATEDGKAWRRRNRLKRLYGLTEEAYDEMVKSSGGKCSVCLSDEELVVDHDHSSGRVRGILCDRCNKALGLVYDKADLLEGLIRYLNKT